MVKRAKKNKELSIAITGNRHPASSDHLLIKSTINKIMSDKKVAEVIFGGAQGVDTVALLCALLFKEKNPYNIIPKLTVIIPCTMEEQPSSTREVTESADEIVELCHKITSSDGYNAYRARNEVMVDRADRIVAFWDGEARSGTFMTINLAKQKKKPFEIIDIAGSDNN